MEFLVDEFTLGRLSPMTTVTPVITDPATCRTPVNHLLTSIRINDSNIVTYV
jgi:hypothetical protein